jgi:hypothetical protein
MKDHCVNGQRLGNQGQNNYLSCALVWINVTALQSGLLSKTGDMCHLTVIILLQIGHCIVMCRVLPQVWQLAVIIRVKLSVTNEVYLAPPLLGFSSTMTELYEQPDLLLDTRLYSRQGNWFYSPPHSPAFSVREVALSCVSGAISSMGSLHTITFYPFPRMYCSE